MAGGPMAALAATVIEKAIGETQVAGVAPSNTPASPPASLIGSDPAAALSALAQQGNFGQIGAGIDPAQPLESAITPPASAQAGPSALPGPPTVEDDPLAQGGGLLGKIGQGANSFFGNLDQNLQSPSKIIGLGLLNRIDPRLGIAGLLGGGLFGDKKVF